MIDLSKITTKIKLHLLSHLEADIVRFGPLVGIATEAFECFNAIFRYCSILSNHLAPSQDIAFQLASQAVMKHRLIGGWWPTETGEWERPGPDVRNFIHAHPTLQALVGWTSAEPLINGQSFLLIASSSLINFRNLQTGAPQTKPFPQAAKTRQPGVVPDTRCPCSQLHFARCKFGMDSMPKCHCIIGR